MGSTAPPTGQPLPFKDGEFTSLSQPSRVSFSLDKLHPPSDLYITRDDVLVLEGICTVLPETFTVNARMLTLDGVVVPLQRTLTMAAANTVTDLTIPLAEGFLLTLVISAATTLQRGQSFVRAWLNRGPTLYLNAMQGLVSDYVAVAAAVGWPGGRVLHPVEGPGAVRTLGVAAPGVGAEWTFTVGTRQRINLMGLQTQLTTSATAITRNVRIEIRDDTTAPVWRGLAQQGIPASQVAAVSAANGVTQSVVVTTDIMVPLPSPCVLGAGFQLRSVTQNLQAGDQWGALALLAESWLDQI